MGRILAFLYGIQTSIHDTFADRIASFAQSHDWAALLAILPLGVVFGLAHAMTPGHSKSVLASYLVGSNESRWRGWPPPAFSPSPISRQQSSSR